MHPNRTHPIPMAERLIVALDVPTIAQATHLVETLDGTVSFFKLGLWLANASGFEAFVDRLIAEGKKIFLDTKMYDIGQTVQEGVARAVDRNITCLTVHGDEGIMAAAMRGRGNAATKILAVTVLTSLDDAALDAMGYRYTAAELVRLRATQAARCGCDGIIASPADNPDVLRRAASAPDLLIVTPGVRRATDDAGDQRRIATPEAAIAAGSDYLVVGRPIASSADPLAAARGIIADMEKGAALQHA